MLFWGLTSLLDSGKNKAIAAAATAAAAPAACCRWCCWRWCCKPPKRTLRHTETPCYWRTERPPKTCCPRGLTSLLILVKTQRVQLLGLLGLLGLLLLLLPLHAASGAAGGGAASFQNSPFATPKHHATEGRNDLQKHVPRGLTSLLDSGKNKASSAAGPAGPAGPAAAAAAAAAGAATRGGAASLQNAPFATPKHHATEGETTLLPWACPFWTKRPPNQSQEQVPWRPERPFWNPTRNHLLSYPAIVLESSLILLSY